MHDEEGKNTPVRKQVFLLHPTLYYIIAKKVELAAIERNYGCDS